MQWVGTKVLLQQGSTSACHVQPLRCDEWCNSPFLTHLLLPVCFQHRVILKVCYCQSAHLGVPVTAVSPSVDWLSDVVRNNCAV